MATATATLETIPKYINTRAYPVITIDGSGGRRTIYPGEVVQGKEYAKDVNTRHGLLPYNGPRQIGAMRKVGLSSNVSSQQRNNENNIPGLLPARNIDGATVTDKLPTFASNSNYLGKSMSEWAEQAEKSGLIEMSRGQLLGFGQFLGLDIAENTSKKDAASIICAHMKSVAKE